MATLRWQASVRMAGISDEYHRISQGAGQVDLASRGRLRFTGSDAVSFLHALVSNDVATLAEGAGVYATYLTPQGRMISDLELYRRSDGVLAGVEPGVASSLAAGLEQLVFSEEVRIADESDATMETLVVGRDAAAVVGDAVGLAEGDLVALPELSQIDWKTGFIARAGGAKFPAFKVFGPAGERRSLVAALERAGAAVVSDSLLDVLRIEAGRPRFGVDMTAETIPLEAGLLERAISTTKGCYVGQEIVIRILHRGGGRVARRLVTLTLTADGNAPGAGAALAYQGHEVGRLTSVAPAPSAVGSIALGYVAREAAEPGNVLTVEGSGTSATITGFAG